MEAVILIGAGFLGAALTTISGVGWGVICTPILLTLLRLTPIQAVATTLIGGLGLNIIAGVIFYRLGVVDFRAAGLLVVGAVGGALAGSQLAASLPEPLLRRVIALMIIGVGVQIFLRR
ncbi:MAG: sulfite exporter TauE/SafE family protein [Deltaproteobacteria bacterium]|nr:sulfite exporter TauE/SafE family protein [Deltaproteobacteria bacterium]